ncbi:MAG: alpha-2-macroglobulin family protein [Kofleriaceae bacterium]
MRRPFYSLVSVWAAVTTIVGGCPASQPVARPVAPPTVATTKPAPVVPHGRPEVTIEPTPPSGGEMALELETPPVEATAGVSVHELPPAETQALLARLEPLPAAVGPAPVMRPPSAMPPAVGVVQPIAFVAPTGAAVGDKPAVRAPVLLTTLDAPQILPVGEVPAESEIRVRFSEPMVAIDKVGAAPAAIATIEPTVTGTWKWLDTRVASFTAAGPRLAQATDYKVTVPAGTKALSGAILAVPAVGTFSTPAVEISSLYPSPRALRSDAPLAVQLDQDVDPAAMIARLKVLDRGHPIAFTPTTLEAAQALWAKNPLWRADDHQLGAHYVLLAPRSGAWPAGKDLDVTLTKGAPSREGPRLLTRDSRRDFTVVKAFAVTGLDCNYTGRPRLARTCPEDSIANLDFTTNLDEKAFRAEMIQTDGQPLEDHITRGTGVSIKVPSGAGKTSQVVISDELRDMYGQALTGPHHLAITASRFEYSPYLEARRGLYVLDPRFAIPQWVLTADAVDSVHVELYRVEPADYFAYQQFEANKRKTPPGTRMFTHDYAVGARYGADIRVDLRAALANAPTGHVVAIATTHAAAPAHRYDYFEPRAVAWIEITSLGISSRVDQQRVHAWIEDITPTQFLKPRANVTTRLVVENRADVKTAVVTDATGAAVLDLPPPLPAPKLPNVEPPEHTALIVASDGKDSVFAALDRSEKSVRVETANWYVTDDRFTYKPGEPVYIKGWTRWTHDGINPGLALPRPHEQVTWEVHDARDNKLAAGTAAFSDQGGFDFTFDIPANANLGAGSVELAIGTEHYSHRIAIQEFRTPAYQVSLDDDVQSAGIAPLILGETISMNAEAHYYAGGGLGGAHVQWDARMQPATYHPPGWDLYSFEPARPRNDNVYHRREGVAAERSTSLGGGSSSMITLGITAVPEGEPAVLSVDATVTDVDRQTIRSTSRDIVVHPAANYVGLRLAPETYDTLLLVVTDLDGNLVPNVPIDVVLEGTLYSEQHASDAKIHDTQRCTATSSTVPVPCKFTPTTDRQIVYRAVATIHDARGRRNTAMYMVPWYRFADDKSTLFITSDHTEYRAGATANLEIHSTVVPASAVVSYARQGVIAQQRIELVTPVTKLAVPMDVGYLENLIVHVDRSAPRDLSQDTHRGGVLPEHTTAELDLRVDLEASRLVMRAFPTVPSVQPGANATFEVEVKRGDQPVANAEVALIVVDEAVLALSGMHHADPLAPFYREVESGATDLSTFDAVADADLELEGVPGYDRINLDVHPRGFGRGFGSGAGYGTIGHGSGGGVGMASSVVVSRKDFRATAVFSPHLHTDANGHATVTVKMPESLTRFRVVALATSQTYFFGKAEGSIVTQRKINARTQAPRFLTQGDRFELPVVVQNLDTTAHVISVATRARDLVGGGGTSVTIPAGQRAEVRFPFSTQARGQAVIQTIVVSGDFSDAANTTVPVYEPATTETFATYGTVDDAPAHEQLKVPAGVFADVGGVEAELSSTQMQALTDAYGYLQAYPYECAEQRSSRMLGTIAMADVLDAFGTADRPSPQELALIQQADLAKLEADQNPDGGWGYWRDTKTDEFVTMQVVTAFAAAKHKGGALDQGKQHVAKLLADTNAALAKARRGDDVAYKISVAADALTALAATGLDERAAAARLHATAKQLGVYPVDAKAQLLAIVAKSSNTAMRAELVAGLLSATHETPAGATVATTYTESEKLLLVSDHRTTALAMDALIRESPQQPLIAKLARGLLAARAYGRWRSTQENLAVMRAMRRYFDAYEQTSPNYTGKLWLGNVAYTEQAFVGHTNLRAQAALDWTRLAPGTTHDLALAKTGPGRMYYRIGITYAPKQVDLPALDAGFIVRRSYQAIDDPHDVEVTPAGVRIKLGARVLVVLDAVNTTRREGVALVDPLPAGLEIVNTSLAIAERAATGSISTDWNHLEARDNRSEAFALTLREGTHRFSYTARASTPGTFVAAPAKAEEMYSPETFGRSAGTTVTIY